MIADFIYKIEIVVEEADESLYWLEVAREAALVAADSGVDALMKEANEWVSIFNATDITAKKNRNK
ncbi:MAG TPA: four helix bundle protein [Agriterribacter sp.]|nr:four helix bundle protein [Agriterribacter sp.]HRQ50523.1 four helix bundle protein [Agriterribacter sp.]